MKKSNNIKKETMFQAQNIFLTYSQCDLSKEEIKTFIINLCDEKKLQINYLLIGIENHQDHKGKHHHVFFQTNKQFRTRDLTIFNIPKNIKKEKLIDTENIKIKDFFYSPHIEPRPGNPIKDTTDVRNYVKKDGDFIEEGTFKHVRYIKLSKNEKPTELESLTNNYFLKLREEYQQKEINISKTKTEIFKKLKLYAESLEPNYAFKNAKRFKNMVFEYIFESDIKELPIFDFCTFKKIPILTSTYEILETQKEQLSNSISKRFKTLIVEGNSKSGKTQFFKSVLTNLELPFNYIKDDVDFSDENYDEDKCVNIYDDIDIYNIQARNLTKVIIGNQKDSIVNMKYKPRTKIKGTDISIMLVNEDTSIEKYCCDNFKRGRKEYKYIRENAIFINLDKHTITHYEYQKYENEQAVIQHFEIPKNWDGLLYFLDQKNES